jgi:hypothetical protein
VATPLSEYWAVEYHFNSDTFTVSQFPDYLTHAQRAARDGSLFDSVILDLRQTRDGASEECDIWQKKRDERPLSSEERLADFRFCQSNLNGHELEAVNPSAGHGQAIYAEYWGVEYHFFRDGFFLRPFLGYLSLAQADWEKRQLFGSVIVALRQAEQDASEEGKSWQAVRDNRRLSVADRQAKVQPYIDGLESLL